MGKGQTKGEVIEITYKYKIKAEYPSEILVSQRVDYEIEQRTGKLQTQRLHDRVAQ